MHSATHDQTEKLTDLGSRIAHVAHELKVPLSLITGSLDTLDQHVDALVKFAHDMADDGCGGEQAERLRTELRLDYVVANAPKLLAICHEGTDRLKRVVQQLRAYARHAHGASAAEVVDLEAVLRVAVDLACGPQRRVRVQLNLASLPLLPGDGQALSQAFVNIIGNAADAVADTAEPSVWIDARPVIGAPGPVPSPRAALADRWVEVRVRDNGPGVPSEVRDRIFEPFFSTKGPHSGMGLGLAIAREVVQSHGGSIELVARSGPGAEFVVRLPDPPVGL